MIKSKAAVFDLDDTLYLERYFVKSGFNAVAQWLADNRQLDRDQVFDVLWSLFREGHRGDLFDRLIEDFATLNVVLGDLITVYRQHTPNIEPLKGIVTLLKSLRLSKKLGLLSDGFLEVQRKKLHALELVGYFDSVVFSDELGRKYWKPNKVPFELILQQLKVKPNETIYVADNPYKDFKGPNLLGMNTIRIRLEQGEHYNKEPQSSIDAPTFTVSSVEELSASLL